MVLRSVILFSRALNSVICVHLAALQEKDKPKKSSKRSSRSESRSRSPPSKSKSGRRKRDDRSRSPSVDEEARRKAKEARYVYIFPLMMIRYRYVAVFRRRHKRKLCTHHTTNCGTPRPSRYARGKKRPCCSEGRRPWPLTVRGKSV